LLLAAGMLTGKRFRASRWLSAAALFLLLVFSSAFGSGILLRSLESQYPDNGIEALPRAQAIVVLGGALHVPTPHHRNSGVIDPSDRILHALRLYRAGKAPIVLCSGGGEQTPESPAMGRLLQEWGVPAEAILREEQSLNTRENALFSYSLLSARGMRHILLVTSAVHMPRAAAVFRKAGFEVTPAPADFRTGWRQGGGFFNWLIEWVPETTDLQRSDGALKELIGLLAYRFRGWA
jgi:uncharacterized SAM-binding protein YcdF (DUF218 family)